MPHIKAIIFDFIGTLTNVKNYRLENSKMKLYKALVDAGFNISVESFLEAYTQAHEKYRVIRYEKLVEVTNAVWISEALNNLGFKVSSEDSRIKIAVNIFFEDYLNSLELRPCAKRFLEKTSIEYKLGVISNFTYAPVIYAGLRKMGINHFFNAVLVSEDVGWRKPHQKIFQEALQRLKVKAEEAVYVGDSPAEDIAGAKKAGMKTVFIPSQFYSHEDLKKNQQKPEIITKDICTLYRTFPKILNKINH
ncbi:MAG: HAD family hydrolase [Candidatus Bathyarchaeota archaeon]|nr:HAD family hydrolase [Candidatus Bathyarchaeota archaeon]